jgi:hypothetical protein
MPNAYYITMNETIPYKLISKNRIFDLDWIIQKLEISDEEEDNDVSEEE